MPASSLAEFLFKSAAPRFMREMARGALSSADLARLGPGSALGVRRRLQEAATDLLPDQLARHRRLQGLLGQAFLHNGGGVPRNMPGLGAGMVAGEIYASPQAGTQLRLLSDGGLKKFLGTGVMSSGRDLPARVHQQLVRPEDGGVFRSVLNHERGEKRMLEGFPTGAYKPNFFASHLGPAANLAERQGVRDPAVHSVFDNLRRTTGKDDPQAYKLFRQAGVVAGNAPPLGGRAHRSLERRIEQLPVAASEGGYKRLVQESYLPPKSVKEFDDSVKGVDSFIDRASRYLPGNVGEAAKAKFQELRKHVPAPNTERKHIYRSQEDVLKHIAQFSSL